LKKRIKYLNFIGLLLFAVILYKIDYGQIVKYLRDADYRYLFLAYPLILINIFLKAVRWNLLMRSQGTRIPVLETFYVYLWAFYFGTVTPGRIGEVSKAIYFQDRFDNIGRSFVSVFVDRAYDVGIRLALLFILYPLYSNLFDFNYIGFLLLFIIAISGIVLLIKMKSIRNIVAKFSKFVLPKKYYPVISKNISGFVNDTVMMITGVKPVAKSVLLTLPSFLCYCLVAFLILKSFSIEMDFTYIIFCLVVSSFSVMVPISISGLGVREAVMIYLFSSIGLGKEAAVLFSLSIFMLSPVLGLHGWIINLVMMVGSRFKKAEEEIEISDAD